MTTEASICMVVGQTGNGKSSLIKIFCGDLVSIDLTGDGEECKKDEIVGHGTTSKTKNTSFFREKINQRIWVDTMGTSDSSGTISSTDILRGIMSNLYRKFKNGLNVKVIWIVKQDVRKSQELQLEAKFISSLSEYSSCNIWDSTLIIVKEDKLLPKRCNGSLAAAYDCGASLDSDNKSKSNDKLGKVDRIGYTIVSALKDDDEILEGINDNEFTDKYRLKMGWLYNNEIKEYIDNKLKNKPFVLIKFKEQICKKCSLKGDGRFLPVKCHKLSQMVHKFDNQFIHTGNIKYKHKNNTFLYNHKSNSIITYSHKYSSYSSRHSGKLIKKHENNTYIYSHSGSFKKNHKHKSDTLKYRHNGTVVFKHKSTWSTSKQSGTEIYKSGTTKLCGNGHSLETYGQSLVITTTDNGLNCKHSGCTIYESESVWHCTACSPNNFGIKHQGEGSYDRAYWCKSHTSERDDYSSRPTYKRVYDCCGGDYPSSTGCVATWNCCNNGTSHKGCVSEYSCCGKSSSSSGCVSEWSCCYNTSESHQGCVMKYKCCSRSTSDSGCIEEWSCCSNNKNNGGCIFEWNCCGNSKYHKGCVEKWSCCNNDRSHKGCVETYTCCNKSSNSQGCYEYYDCCNNSKDGPPCSYKCCRKKIKDSPKPCHKICRNCHVEWGKGPGCTQENVQHKF